MNRFVGVVKNNGSELDKFKRKGEEQMNEQLVKRINLKSSEPKIEEGICALPRAEPKRLHTEAIDRQKNNLIRADHTSRPDGAESIGCRSAVSLAISNNDRTILTALIDRTASQKRIIDDLRRALPQFAVPYRELEPLLVEAIRLKLKENITFGDASLSFFGIPNHARTIRYWRNRWELQ